ncbi:transcriptional regulator [Natronomonas sp.]|uniref:transcriptional regulator n=1 Tax=Natronomonas sp. TaxID=2184060 RepID=UPI002620060E|nr:transcriptional regulator [Natronomonas sp.]
MTYTCRNCKRTFTSELQYELHRDTCSADALVCERCGEQFSERQATRDGWHYACPTDGCEGSGRGEDLHPVHEFSVAVDTR